tara:strand:+ start:1238 stop:1663 length:426 start_codon:yes stop_codon:yes gene_type:complete
MVYIQKNSPLKQLSINNPPPKFEGPTSTFTIPRSRLNVVSDKIMRGLNRGMQSFIGRPGIMGPRGALGVQPVKTTKEITVPKGGELEQNFIKKGYPQHKLSQKVIQGSAKVINQGTKQEALITKINKGDPGYIPDPTKKKN